MQNILNLTSDTALAEVLRRHDIQPTAQRLSIASVLFTHRSHLSAEDVFRLVNGENRRVSKATVYNTLGLLADKGVIREVIADPSRIFYDPNTEPHHHFFDVDTGELTDISADQIHVTGLPPLPAGAKLDGVDVIVRLRPAK